MFNELRAEITQLIGNAVFLRNLSVTLFVAIALSCSLAELQSQNSSLGERLAIANNYSSLSIKIIVRHK